MKKENGETETNNGSSNNCDSAIELEPFIHQVGGRSTILVLGKYICKPINQRELNFYQTLDQYASSLKPFVAQYYGIISVNFEESDDGYLVITTTKSHLKISTNELNNNNNNDFDKKGSINNDNGGNASIDSSDSPYQKFVTKYRIKLVRPIKEIIIESHEQPDVDNKEQLQNSKNNKTNESTVCNSHNNQHLKRYILTENKENRIDPINTNHNHHRQNNINNNNNNNNNPSTIQTNLNRSRSTSISIPNFEDGNFNQSDLTSLFDNQLFMNEVGHNYGCSSRIEAADHKQQQQHQFRKISSPDSSVRLPVASTTGSGTADAAAPASASADVVVAHTSPTSPKAIHNLSTTKHNPWVLKTFSVLSEFNESMKEQKFILLENLTSNFEYPCIMDLKMGTRLHDDMATQTKIQSHESKVNETTSGVLGLRVTGIQIYDKNLDKFICYNKYYGRKLTPETFRSTLKMFVSNENFVQHKLLERMIERLQKLRSIIVELDGFRFYTSSLLLIYEGNTCRCNTAATNNNNNNKRSKDPVDSCEFCRQDPDKLFDVRVIDFAHSTHPNSSPVESGETPLPPSLTSHKGYDEGFVYGLDNLIKILTLFLGESN